MYALLLFFFLFSLRPFAIAQPPGGLTFESCLTELGCTAPRKCIDTLTFRRCKNFNPDSQCICAPPSFISCTSSSTCIEGEVCARTQDIPFICVSEVYAGSRNGPVTAEDAADTPLIPKCPRPKRPKNPDRKVSKQAPPGLPPDAVPGGPPDLPPDNAPGGPDLQPVPGSPAPLPPQLDNPKRNGLDFETCGPGTCAKGLSCVVPMAFGDGPGAGPPPPDGLTAPGQSFRCCTEDDIVCLCHPQDSRSVCVTTADCNRGELCAKSPITPPTCTSRDKLDDLTPGQKKRVVILEGKRPGKPGRPVPLVETPTPSAEVDEGPENTTKVEKQEPKVSEKPVESSPSEEATVTPAPSVTVASVSPPTTGIETDETEASPAAEVQDVEGICIDASALRHLKGSDVLFKQDRLARVLCDIHESCATAGHMVRFEGKAMMMQSYCNLAGCEEKVIKVNSPRYRRRLIVHSRTEGLEYTALAARYATRAEEGVLAAVIHAGL